MGDLYRDRVRRRRHVLDSTGAFRPTDLSGLVGWWKADAGVTMDGANRVSAWADQSGTGRDVSQGTGTAQPLYVASSLNGRPVLRFDGTDMLVNAGVAVTADLTMFAVALVSGGAYPQGICNADTGSRFFQFRYASAVSLEALIFANGGANTSDTQAVTATAAKVLTMQRRPLAVQAWVNGVSDGATAYVGTADAGTTAFQIGAASSGSGMLTGDLAELLWYATALSATDRQAVEAYLTSRYGIT